MFLLFPAYDRLSPCLPYRRYYLTIISPLASNDLLSTILSMILFRRVLLVVVLAVSCSRVYAQDEEDTGGTTTAEEVGESAPTTTTTTNIIGNNNARSSPCNEKDWGSFYDPNNIFCGKFDCYKILCFDYETWGSDPPTLKAITQSYRNLSRKWHPDKNKAKGAREKFVVSTIK